LAGIGNYLLFIVDYIARIADDQQHRSLLRDCVTIAQELGKSTMELVTLRIGIFSRRLSCWTLAMSLALRRGRIGEPTPPPNEDKTSSRNKMQDKRLVT
jgi:hypothetical protein